MTREFGGARHIQDAIFQRVASLLVSRIAARMCYTVSMAAYQRVILKLSGEVLSSNSKGAHLDFKRIRSVAVALKEVHRKKIQLAVVMGAGNIFRARYAVDGALDRVAADHMGMMGTIINALALQSALGKIGVEARVLSAISMPEIMEDYVHKRAIKHLKRGRIVIFAAGTGRPYFTTDTAAVMRALEIKADVVLKASDVDGVYDRDPKKSKKAKRFETLTFTEALEKRLAVMDGTAFSLALENQLPVVVFKYSPKNLMAACTGGTVGTLITE